MAPARAMTDRTVDDQQLAVGRNCIMLTYEYLIKYHLKLCIASTNLIASAAPDL